jgi:sensor histidine kinase YesM
MQLLVLFTPIRFYTRFGYIINIIEIAGVVGTLIIVMIGIKCGHKYGWLNLVSSGIVLIAYIHDVLYWTNVTTSKYGEMIYVGVFLFILIQMIIQAKKINEFYDNKIAAELSFLQAQIKPHFLYNAINTFIAISHYDVDQSRRLLIDFSKYLRKSFDFKDLSQKTSLKNEMELVEAYVEIEKVRFEERLIVHFDICEDLEVQVPILVLQPIIENAINHGVLHRQEGGQVDIIIKKKERLLIFTVKDNGVGMEISKDKNIGNKDINGIGLYNIDMRLKKLYKKGLTIHSIIGIGTEITWFIPIEKD